MAALNCDNRNRIMIVLGPTSTLILLVGFFGLAALLGLAIAEIEHLTRLRAVLSRTCA